MLTSAQSSPTANQARVFYHHPASDRQLADVGIRAPLFEHQAARLLQSPPRDAQVDVESSSSSGRTFRGSALPLADNSKAGPLTTARAT